MIRFVVVGLVAVLSSGVTQAQVVSLHTQRFPDLSDAVTYADTITQTTNSIPETQTLRKSESKSMAMAMGLSILVPGAGQVYNGETVKGIVFLGLFAGGVAAADAARFTQSHRSISAYGWLSVAYVTAVYAWNIFDAPISAKKINRELETQFDAQPREPPRAADALLPAAGAPPVDVIMRVEIGL